MASYEFAVTVINQLGNLYVNCCLVARLRDIKDIVYVRYAIVVGIDYQGICNPLGDPLSQSVPCTIRTRDGLHELLREG